MARTAIVFALPLDAPTWILYGFAIANAALWRGPLGVFAATAASILAYDITLIARIGEAPATSLWVVQALVAIGLISAELVYSAVRATADRERMRRHGHALRAFAEARGSATLLETLRAQILALGAVHVRMGTDEKALRDSLEGKEGFVERLPTREPRYIAVILPAGHRGRPAARDASRATSSPTSRHSSRRTSVPSTPSVCATPRRTRSTRCPRPRARRPRQGRSRR